MHEDQTDGGLYNDQTDADLQMLIYIMIILWYLNLHMGTFEIKVEIKIIQYVHIHKLMTLQLVGYSYMVSSRDVWHSAMDLHILPWCVNSEHLNMQKIAKLSLHCM